MTANFICLAMREIGAKNAMPADWLAPGKCAGRVSPLKPGSSLSGAVRSWTESSCPLSFFRVVFRLDLRGPAGVRVRWIISSSWSCQSANQSTFNGEIAIHFPGLEGVDKPIVWVFPKVLVCLNCGFTEFAVPEKELGVLVSGSSGGDATVVSRENDAGKRKSLSIKTVQKSLGVRLHQVLPPRY